MSRENVFGWTRRALTERLEAMGVERFRARQVYRWMYARRATRFDAMTDLGAPLRARLEAALEIRHPEPLEQHLSADGTVRHLLRLSDDRRIETVTIPETGRQTVCVSTQVGCPLQCGFCFSGTVRLERNLTAGEILGQFVRATETVTPRPARLNVVYMGMGEPLLNPEAVLESLEILTDPEGFALSPRRVTVSTAGLAEALPRFAERAPPVGIAISLHATTNAARERLMPINRRYPIEAVLDAARKLPLPRRRRITFEYVLLGEVNDAPADADRLAALVSGIRAKVNLIAFNPWPGVPYRPSTPIATARFVEVLTARGLTVSVRRSRGDDVLAACGQLAGTAVY